MSTGDTQFRHPFVGWKTWQDRENQVSTLQDQCHKQHLDKFFSWVTNRHPPKNDKLSINSADVQKDRNKTRQWETESRDSKNREYKKDTYRNKHKILELEA